MKEAPLSDGGSRFVARRGKLERRGLDDREANRPGAGTPCPHESEADMRYVLAVLLCGCTTINLIAPADGGADGPALGNRRDAGTDMTNAADLDSAPDLESGDMASASTDDLSAPDPPDLEQSMDLARPDLVTGPDMTIACGGNAVPMCNTSGVGPLCCNGASCINGNCWNAPGGYCCIDANCNPIVACWQQQGVATGVCGADHRCQ